MRAVSARTVDGERGKESGTVLREAGGGAEKNRRDKPGRGGGDGLPLRVGRYRPYHLLQLCQPIL